MKYYEIEDLIRAIEEFSGFVDPDDRERAFEESGLGDMLNMLKEGVADASKEESAEPAVEGSNDGEVANTDDVPSSPTVE